MIGAGMDTCSGDPAGGSDRDVQLVVGNFPPNWEVLYWSFVTPFDISKILLFYGTGNVLLQGLLTIHLFVLRQTQFQ